MKKRCPYCGEPAARQGFYIVCTICERVLGEAPPVDWTKPPEIAAVVYPRRAEELRQARY